MESVLQAHESLQVGIEHGALLQLHPTGMSGVHLLQPALVSGRSALVNMLLEHNDVGIRNILCVHGREDRSCLIVDGADLHGRSSCQQREQCQAEEAFHDGQSERLNTAEETVDEETIVVGGKG